jgi:hypothetical protein
MKTIKININGKEVEINLTKEQLKQIESQNAMQKVYKYHNTTEEQFEKDYKNLPLHLKYLQKEIMIVAYKNNGWKPDMNDDSQKKYYYWFNNSPFSFYDSYYTHSVSNVASSFLLQDEQKCREIVKEFLPELEQSRTTLAY